MRKFSKALRIITAALIFAALTVSMTGCNMIFKELTIYKYDVKDSFHSISVNSDTADVTFHVSDDGKTRVECYDDELSDHSVTIDNGVLKIKLTSEEQDLANKINFGFIKLKIKVYLPAGEHGNLSVTTTTGDVKIPSGLTFSGIYVNVTTGDVKISASSKNSVRVTTTTGDINISEITAGELDLTATTGDVKVTDTTGTSLISNATTGDVDLKNVKVTEDLNILRETGDVELDRCDAAEIYIKTTTGDVEGSLLSEKVFTTNTSTGDVKVPSSENGGKCEITTTTGDIKISIVK